MGEQEDKTRNRSNKNTRKKKRRLKHCYICGKDHRKPTRFCSRGCYEHYKKYFKGKRIEKQNE